MLTKRNIFLFGVVAFAILFWAWVSFGYPIDVNACRHYAANGDCEYHAPEHIYLFLPGKLGELLRDSAFVTALATIAIGVFTFFLVRVSNRQAKLTKAAVDIAKTSADALPIIEGAYVFPNIIRANIAGSLSAFSQLPELSANRFSVDYEFKNFGKTPSIILRAGAQLVHRDRTAATGLAMAPPDIVVLGTNQPTGPEEALIADFSRKEWESVISGKTKIHFFGGVVYSDIFGNEWAFDFDWQYSPGLSRFIPDNQPRRQTKHYVLKADPP